MGLIAHYKLNGDAKDSVGLADGVISNVSWVETDRGVVGDFIRGTDQGIYIPENDHLNNAVFGINASVSLSTYVNLRSYGSHGIIVGKLSGNHYSNVSCALWVTSSNILFVISSNVDGNPTGSSLIIGTNVPINTWCHICGVSDGKTMEFWVDGVLVATKEIVFATPRVKTGGEVQIGTPRTKTDNEGVDGLISDVRVYDHPLSKREIRDINLGLISHFPFISDTEEASPNHIATTPVNCHVDKNGVNFNGSSSFIDLQDGGVYRHLNNAPISIACWIRPTAFTSRDMVLSRNNHRSNNPYTFLFGLIYADMSAYDGTEWHTFTTSHLIGKDQWNHVCWTFDGVALTAYVNGVVVGITSTYTYSQKLDQTTKVGGYGDGKDFNGSFKDLRVYSAGLSGNEVKEIYQQRASITKSGDVFGLLVEKIPYTSPMDSATTGWINGGVNDFPVSAESDPCSGPLTFLDALSYAKNMGGRLPTKEELLAGVANGTGCGYDSQYCWTCDKGLADDEHWVVYGDGRTSPAPKVIKDTETAMVRFVADDDIEREDPVTINDETIRGWLFP